MPIGLSFFWDMSNPFTSPSHTQTQDYPVGLRALEVALSPKLCWIRGPVLQNSCSAKWSAATSQLKSLRPRLSLKSGHPGPPAARNTDLHPLEPVTHLWLSPQSAISTMVHPLLHMCIFGHTLLCVHICMHTKYTSAHTAPVVCFKSVV